MDVSFCCVEVFPQSVQEFPEQGNNLRLPIPSRPLRELNAPKQWSQSPASLKAIHCPAQVHSTDKRTSPSQSPWQPSDIIRKTYSRELNSTITTFGRGSGFLDVKVSKFSAWGLDNADLVRSGVVSGNGISQGRNLTMRYVSLRVATSVCQSVGTHLGEYLRRRWDVVVIAVVGLKFREIACSRKNVWES
jgi:hypothetical protein